MGVFYMGGRGERCGVFRRHCVGMILGWDFYWLEVGQGCDVFLWGGRVRKGRSKGLQTTRPTSGGAVTADASCCANCVKPSCPQQWGD